ncbi:MAG TPA: Uma2 family endonuclease [Gemmatimonadales bacterium]|nr:Uma2 family endonuclease [Gemmatimonadales bacterium]
MGMAAPTFFTAQMVRALPEDGNRYETVRGELLVTPAPRVWHEEIVGRLYVALRHYLSTDPVGHVFGSHSDISWGPDTLVEPDVLVAPLEEVRTLEWSRVKTLLLVVEVLSPSSRRADRFTKRVEYQRQNIPCYWIVDPDERQVEAWSPADTFPAFERERLIWHPAGAGRPFELSLEELFRAI